MCGLGPSELGALGVACETCALESASILTSTRTLLGAPGIATRSDRTLLGAKGIATWGKEATRNKKLLGAPCPSSEHMSMGFCIGYITSWWTRIQGPKGGHPITQKGPELAALVRLGERMPYSWNMLLNKVLNNLQTRRRVIGMIVKKQARNL